MAVSSILMKCPPDAIPHNNADVGHTNEAMQLMKAAPPSLRQHLSEGYVLTFALTFLIGETAAFATAARKRRKRHNRFSRSNLWCFCGSNGSASQIAAGTEDSNAKRPLLELEQAMRAAAQREDFEEAARLRDELQTRKMQGEMAVLCINRDFFAAVGARDLERMAELWHQGDHSCCIHQAKRPVHGYQAVMESWVRAFREKKRRRDAADYVVQSVVIRDGIGRIVATSEKANAVITNLFEHTPDGWRMWCHQAGAIEAVKQTPAVIAMAQSVPSLCARLVKTVISRVRQPRRKQQRQQQHQPQPQRVAVSDDP